MFVQNDYNEFIGLKALYQSFSTLKEVKMSLNSRIFRFMCKKADTARDEGLTTPESITRFDNIVYGSDSKWQILDVYRPKDIALPSPVIVSVHGGGWVYGDKEVYQYYCMDLAQRGFAVVNFSYRLAPKHRFPAQIEDTNSVFEWVMKNASQYSFDTGSIFALGDSAGAQMLATYSCILTNPEYAKEYSFKTPEGLRILGIALNCGLYNVENCKNISFFKDFLKDRGTPKELHTISAANFVTDKFPPSFVMTANGDELKDQAPFMEDALKKNNVKHIFREYGDDMTTLYHVFHCNIKSPDAKKANDDECDFFRSLM